MNEIETEKNLLLIQQKLYRWRMAFFGLVILLAGIVIGVSSTFLLDRSVFKAPPLPPPEIGGERLIRDLERHLRFSPEQMEKIKPILKEHMEKLHGIRMNVRPQVIEQLQLMNDEILSLLDEHQKRLWQEHFQQLQRNLQRDPGPRGPGLGPGPRGPGPGPGPHGPGYGPGPPPGDRKGF